MQPEVMVYLKERLHLVICLEYIVLPVSWS